MKIIRDIITCHSDDSNAGIERYLTFHYADTLTNITDVGIAKLAGYCSKWSSISEL